MATDVFVRLPCPSINRRIAKELSFLATQPVSPYLGLIGQQLDQD